MDIRDWIFSCINPPVVTVSVPPPLAINTRNTSVRDSDGWQQWQRLSPWVVDGYQAGNGGGQEVAQFWVGKESISALITSGSHHDCSLWRNSICCHHRREALRAVRGLPPPPITLPINSKHINQIWCRKATKDEICWQTPLWNFDWRNVIWSWYVWLIVDQLVCVCVCVCVPPLLFC